MTNQITVGNASDILIEIICNQTTSGTNSWSFSNGDIVPSPLTNFGISQNPEQGLLRIYPGTLVEDYNQFSCNNGGTSQNITLSLSELTSDDLNVIIPQSVHFIIYLSIVTMYMSIL